MSKPIILVDMDGVCADLLKDWLGIYNRATGRNVTVEDIIRFEMHDCADMGQVIYDHLQTPGLFLGLTPLSGVAAALEELNHIGKVFICSTPSRNPDSSAEKLRWCAKHLPFLPRRQIILCGTKELVRGDYLIEDSPENIRKWKRANPQGQTVLIDYPYNREAEPDFRAHGYKDMAQAWADIVGFIRLRTEMDRGGGA